MNMKGKIKYICVSKEKGTRKRPVVSATFEKDYGIIGDGHAGKWHRQVSLLAEESIERMRTKGLNLGPGDFAENITTQNVDLLGLKVGDVIIAGNQVKLEISQIGKECHSRCKIYEQAGDCIMPKEGIFARVLESGIIKPGDEIYVQDSSSDDK